MIGLDYAHEEAITDKMIDAFDALIETSLDACAVEDDVLPEIPLAEALETLQRIQAGLPRDE